MTRALRTRPSRPSTPPACRRARAAGEAAGTAGLDFFEKLNEAGNFVPVVGKPRTLAQGQTPILVAWDYNALAWRDGLKGNPPVEVVVPKTGVVAGVYVQAISAYAPHPNAAKLWMEYLYSDEGQIGWLGAIATRSASTIWPRPARSRPICSPSCRRLNPMPRPCSRRSTSRAPAKTAITKDWDAVVGANVK